MPANKRPRRVNYAVNKKGPKSNGKVWNAITHYLKLKKRVEVEGETKWLQNAFKIVMVKLKKYWINPNNLQNG
jgi:hypothetical protein